MAPVNAPCLIILRGLPGSGKTTWAKVYTAAHPDVVRVNQDELRAMLHVGRAWNMVDEAVTARVRDTLIVQALLLGRSVISDDTNLTERHVTHLQALVAPLGVTIECIDMLTPIEECVARDARREQPVGEQRIREMDAQRKGLS